jgi:hypothetical protein
MSYHDPNAQHRFDRMIVVYQFESTTPVVVNLTCDGHHPQIVLDLGGSPLELELVTDDVTALAGLINALTDARQRLIDHQATHVGTPDPDQPLYVPDTWTSDPEAGPTDSGDPA